VLYGTNDVTKEHVNNLLHQVDFVNNKYFENSHKFGKYVLNFNLI